MGQNSVNSVNLINHWSMKLGQFMDPIFYLYLAGAVVASWSFTQVVAGSNRLFKIWLFLSLNSTISMKTFRENSIIFLSFHLMWVAISQIFYSKSDNSSPVICRSESSVLQWVKSLPEHLPCQSSTTDWKHSGKLSVCKIICLHVLLSALMTR